MRDMADMAGLNSDEAIRMPAMIEKDMVKIKGFSYHNHLRLRGHYLKQTVH